MKAKDYIFVIFGISLCVLSSISLFTQSIRLDESQQIWISTKSVSTIVSFVATDVHVPLYAILLHFWMQLFGPSIIVARIPSLLFFLATLPVLYITYTEAANKKIAAIATITFASSPFILWYSSEARMYTLFTFATALNMLYFLRFIKTNGGKGKLGYFLSEILGLYSHYFFLFVLITQMVFLAGKFFSSLYQDRYRPKALFWTELSTMQKSIFRLILLMTLGFCFILPWGIYVVFLGGVANTQPLIPPPTTFNIFQTFVNFLFGFQTGGIQSALISFWPILIIILFFLFTQKKILRAEATEYFFLSAFLPILLVYALSYIRPIYLSRYLIFTLPSLFFLIAWAITNYLYKVEKIAIGGFIALLMIAGVYQNYSPATTVKEDYADVSKYLQNNATGSDIIVVTPPFTIYPIEYSYTGVANINAIPDWNTEESGPIPAFSLSKMIVQMKNYQEVYSRMYIITSYDQGYQNKVIDYLDTHFHRLSKKDFSPGLEVRVYKLRYDI